MEQKKDMEAASPVTSTREHSVPLFWPLAAAYAMGQAELELFRKNLKFVIEAQKVDHGLKPRFATPNTVLLELHTLALRAFGSADSSAPATLILAPYAGHSATIADYHEGQSLVQTLLEAGHSRVLVTDWKSASLQMKDYDIDNYLAELNVCIDDLGGRVNLVGLCQGGWMAAMVAARYPDRVQALVLAGAPNDTQYVDKYVRLYEHIDDPDYVSKTEAFSAWYENTIDLPGRWYLQAINELFKENRLATGRFVGLGQRLSLHDIRCPLYLLAGESDDITPKEQVFAAEQLVGTPREAIEKAMAPGGHIGLFMGSRTLRTNWPQIGKWMLAVQRGR